MEGKVESPRRVIVCVTGMPGAGKSTAAHALKYLGYTLINMGDVVRAEASRRRIPPDDKSTGALMLELRKVHGSGAVAELCLQRIEDSGSNLFVIDGVRSMDEVGVFRSRGDVFLLGIHASPAKRFEYLRSRGREDSPLTWNDFCERDQRELTVGVGGSIALSDEVISNTRLSIEKLQTTAAETVTKAARRAEG